MRVASRLKAFRRQASSTPNATLVEEEQRRIGAALAYIRKCGNLDGFPASRNERLAIVTTALRRGIVAWDPRRELFVLTRRGAAQLPASARKGAAAGAPLRGPGDVRDRSVRRPTSPAAATLAIAAWLGLAASIASGSFKVTSAVDTGDRPSPSAIAVPGTGADPTRAPDAAPGARPVATAGLVVVPTRPAAEAGSEGPASGEADLELQPQTAGAQPRADAASVTPAGHGPDRSDPGPPARQIALSAHSSPGVAPPPAQGKPGGHRRNRDAKAARSQSARWLPEDRHWWQPADDDPYRGGRLVSAYGPEVAPGRDATTWRGRAHGDLPPDATRRRHRGDEADAAHRRFVRERPGLFLGLFWPFR